MAYRYQTLRLIIPSVCQFNAVRTKTDWCGRTSASMIYNYYYLVRHQETLEQARDKLIANVDEAPHDLVFRDADPKQGAWASAGDRYIAASGYALLGTLRESGIHDWHESAAGSVVPLDPPGEREPGTRSELDVQATLAPVIAALEAFNPVLFYSGLSSGEIHIVVISGYELRRGKLWLHIDDPGQRYVPERPFRIAATLRDSGVAAELGTAKIIDEEPADAPVDPENSGIRYWLRARVLFAENTNTAIPDDLWGDHGDPSKPRDGRNRWGLSAYYSFADTPRSPQVVAVPFASYPVRLRGRGKQLDEAIAELWDKTAHSGAPYPIDTTRVWNNGIRIPGAAGEEIQTIAPGQIVAARLGSATTTAPDRGTIIIQHAFDEREQSFVPFPTEGLTDEQKLVFSLYGRLAPPATDDGNDETATAPHPLIALADPGPEVVFEAGIAPGHALSLLAADKDGTWLQAASASGAAAPARDADAPRSRYLEEDMFAVELAGTNYFVVPVPTAQRNLDAWEDRPRGPIAPEGASLGYTNPLGDLLDTTETCTGKNPPRLAADLTGETPSIVELRAADDGAWCGLEAYDEPGIDLSLHAHAEFVAADELALRAGDNVLVVQVATLRFSTSEAAGRHTLTFQGDQAARLLGCTAGDQSAFDGGDTATPSLVAVVPVGSGVEPGAPISYWDPVDGAVYASTATITEGATAAERTDAPSGFVALEGHAPVLEIPTKGTYALPADEVDALVVLGDDAFPLVCVNDPTLYLSTNAARKFPEARKVALSGSLHFAGTAQYVAARKRLWPKLTPAAFLTADQATAAQAEVEAAFGDGKIDVLDRLQRGESALLGVFLDHHGWVLNDNAVEIDPNRTDPLKLYRSITGAGPKRGFNEKAHLVQYVDATPGLALSCVSVFESWGKRRALIEFRYGTTTLPDNGADVATWRAKAAVRDLLRDADPNAVLNLQSVEDEALASIGDLHRADEVVPARVRAWRDLTSAVVGTMGRTTKGGDVGAHIEVFSEHYIIPTANAARWPQVEETDAGLPGTQEFFAAAQQAITVKDRLAAGTQHGSARAQDTRTPSEWEAYCIEHHRMLSRIVPTHRSQWAVDWNETRDQADPAHGLGVRVDAMPEAERPAETFADVGIPGLDERSYLYYHPLRLVEWLKTGMDVAVRDLRPDTASGLSCELKLGDETFELARPYGDEALFRLRLIAGDPAGGTREGAGQPATLTLNGLPTSPDKNIIGVMLKRGSVGQYSFTEPGAAMELAHQPVGYGLPEAMQGTRAAYGDVMYLLADGNAKLPTSGVSTATVLAASRYNLEMPNTAGVSLRGSGITLDAVTVGGAETEGPDAELKLSAKGGKIRKYPTQSRDVDITATLVPTRSTSADATLTVFFRGGDLEEDFEASLSVRTRVIESGDTGEDVGKLQTYLARIRAGNYPCYVQFSEDSPASRPKIDGSYGSQTAAALWRFVLFFAAMDDWHDELGTIETSTGDVELDRIARTHDDREAKVAELLAAESYPTVNEHLIDELIARHQYPWVPPVLTQGAVTRVAHGREPAPAELKKWDKWNLARKTSVLPLWDWQGGFNVAVNVQESPGGFGQRMAIEVVVLESEGYKLIGAVPKTLHELITTGITVAASGRLTPAGTKPKLKVFAYGRETLLLSLTLGGTPNLVRSPTDGFALAAFQQILTSKGYYDKTVDGENGRTTRKAIDKAAADYKAKKKNQYQELLVKLVAKPAVPHPWEASPLE